uniref:Putative secreted protein n=1 Tax=Rhipicephalus microplus TaxID=6941 RepID=A0A6M2DCW5_RHIMP
MFFILLSLVRPLFLVAATVHLNRRGLLCSSSLADFLALSLWETKHTLPCCSLKQEFVVFKKVYCIYRQLSTN